MQGAKRLLCTLRQLRRFRSFPYSLIKLQEIICNGEQSFGMKFNKYNTKISHTTPRGTISVDFTKMAAVPVYSKVAGQGFVSESGAIRASGHNRKVASVASITISPSGASVTESNGSYLYNKSNSDDGDDYNYGGLIYRYDTGAPGAYHLEVGVVDASNTTVAPNGMQASKLTGTSTWDNCGNVPRTVSAIQNGNVWSYDFATGEDFIEIEIEPNKLPTKDAAQTVGVKYIKITPLAVNPAGDKPTIHILGDSTQKTYSFNEVLSSWGQTLYKYFDADKVNVINYSMGGRAMKGNYNDGRTAEPLVRGKAGDFVFIHSAHNDETLSNNRFSRGSGIKDGTLAQNNTSYQRWLDMYVKMIKARGMIPVLVTAMPRTVGGKYVENSSKPNGFNPDSPALMRKKAQSDPDVGLIELYVGAKKYIDKLEPDEVFYIYNKYEAGETPAENSVNGTKGDGTHFKESAAKQWCRIMLQSIYDQSVAPTDIYSDKAIMKKLVSYMPSSVKTAAESGDWSAVFPELASDVSAVDVVPGAVKQAKDNYYYRTAIEKALQIGALHKDNENKFKPTQTITVGEFARGVETVFGLPENSLSNYNKTYDELTSEGMNALEPVSANFDKEPDIVNATTVPTDAALTREAMGAILYDAYTKANAANGKWITNAKVYMNQKGGVLSPDDPNYDPNITYNGGTYLPLTGWSALTDTDSVNTALYAKVKQAYNLGLMRTEEGIVRGDMKNGTKIQPKTEVTRAKAAKALVFCYILGQLPTDENHLIYMENQADKTVADIEAPNSAAPSTVFGE